MFHYPCDGVAGALGRTRSTAVVSIERHRYRSAGVFGVDVDNRFGVVPKYHVRQGESERCLTDIGVAAEVEAVRLVEDVLVTPEEHSVVEGRRELACAAADVDCTVAAADLTVDNGSCSDLALSECSLAGSVVD